MLLSFMSVHHGIGLPASIVMSSYNKIEVKANAYVFVPPPSCSSIGGLTGEILRQTSRGWWEYGCRSLID